MIRRKSISVDEVARLLSYDKESGEFHWLVDRGAYCQAWR